MALLDDYGSQSEVTTTHVDEVSDRHDGTLAFPASFSQQRMWMLEQLTPGNAAYNVVLACLRLQGPLSVPTLLRSLNATVARHESLRTVFRIIDGKLAQVVAARQPIPLPVEDLSSLPERQRLARAETLAREEALRPYDLEHGPLLRGKLFRLQDNDHLFLLSTHHITSDAWSVQVLAKELSASYAGLHRNVRPDLPELSIQYGDFAVWQHETLVGEPLERLLGYWTKQLQGDLPAVEITPDRVRKSVQGWAGGYESITLPAALREGLERLRLQHDATMFMTLLAVFKVLLSRYTGQTDIVVGTPIAGRERIETEHLIGCFLNTLVLRTDLTHSQSFSNVLARVRETAISAFDHKDLPFEMLVEHVDVDRDLSRNPLFQNAFIYEHGDDPQYNFPGLTVSKWPLQTGTSKFDLTLWVRDTTQGLHVAMEYSADLFDSDTIRRMLSHFQILVERILANPQQPIGTLPMLTADDEQQILVQWNDTATDFPRDRCIHELFEQQVECTPDALALECNGVSLTYAELNCRANQLAHHLRAQGVDSESIVAICVARSPQMIVALLAILKAGGAYVPLDPKYPAQRLEFMLHDSGASIVLTQASLSEALPRHGCQVVCLDRDREEIRQQPTLNPDLDVSADGLAYVIYTSGSTGQPKGVMVEHGSVSNLLHWAGRTLTPAELAGVLVSTSICFDVSVFEMFCPLAFGGRLILVEHALEVGQLSESACVSLLSTVPSAVHELLQTSGIPGSIQTVALCGEPLSAELADQIYEHSNVKRVYDFYGPTEATVYATYALRKMGDVATIGRPIGNTEAYVLDSHRCPVPIGVPGELHIGGSGLARGYLGREELTARSFIDHPFRPGARLYKTGDLVRYRPDGSIAYLGRLDSQVKLRGFRIELAEIESALNAHQLVQRSVVAVCGAVATDDQRLIAYVVPHNGTSPAPEELRAFLAQRLPEYMLPAGYITMDSLPLTDNGKVDRRALPAPNAERPDLGGSYVAPRTSLEQQLATVWCDVLKVDRIGLHDNFFDLGGHSLLAIRLFDRISQQLNRRVEVKTLFVAPTVELLAQAVDEAAGCGTRIAPAPTDQTPLVVVSPGGTLFLNDLAQLLAQTRDFYVLQAPGLDSTVSPPTRVEEIAELHLQELRRILPRGPYALAGRCFSSTVVFEMAKRLVAAGEVVKCIFALDSAPPTAEGVPLPGESRDTLLDRFARLADHWRRADLLPVLRQKFRREIARPLQWCRRVHRHFSATPEEVRQERLERANLIASWYYRAKPVNVRVVLIRSEEFASMPQKDFHNKWAALAQAGFECYEVPGTHVTMFDQPHIQVLAQRIESCLQEDASQNVSLHRIGSAG